MSEKFTDSDLREVLTMGQNKAPAFRFCPTKEMAAALSKALEEKWLSPTTESPWTFALTEKGEAELERICE